VVHAQRAGPKVSQICWVAGAQVARSVLRRTVVSAQPASVATKNKANDRSFIGAM
jgi:hypothetical protein